jgi:hypothetical protein
VYVRVKGANEVRQFDISAVCIFLGMFSGERSFDGCILDQKSTLTAVFLTFQYRLSSKIELMV